MTPDQERRIRDALVAVASQETEQLLESEGILAIQSVLGCSARAAQNVLGEFGARKLIERDITRGGQLDIRKPIPVACWRWVMPSAWT